MNLCNESSSFALHSLPKKKEKKKLNGISSDCFGTITSSLHPLGELLPLILVYPAVAMLLLSYDKSFKIANMWGWGCCILLYPFKVPC